MGGQVEGVRVGVGGCGCGCVRWVGGWVGGWAGGGGAGVGGWVSGWVGRWVGGWVRPVREVGAWEVVGEAVWVMRCGGAGRAAGGSSPDMAPESVSLLAGEKRIAPRKPRVLI